MSIKDILQSGHIHLLEVSIKELRVEIRCGILFSCVSSYYTWSFYHVLENMTVMMISCPHSPG